MYKLSMYQVVCILCTSYLPLLFWIYPRYAAYYGGVDGQWALLGTCLAAMYSAWIHGLLNTRFKNYSGVEMLTLTFGKVLGIPTALMFIPGYVLFVATSLYSYSITVKSILPNTPSLAASGALLLVALVGAAYGLETIARVASIVFPVVMFVLGTSFLLVFFRGTWAGVFFHPVSLSRSISVAGMLLPIFFGFNNFLMLCPFYDHRKRNSVWIPFVSVGLGSFFVLSVYLVTIRVVGYEGLRVLSHPVDFVLQLVQLQGLIIQRFGVGLIFMSTMFEAVFCANHIWALGELSMRVFGAQRKKHKWFVLFYAVVILTVFRLIPDQEVGDWIVINILVPLSWLYLLVEPTIKLLVSYLRRLDYASTQNESPA
ncbi:GerAB/ArcD/ProY family transporter [Alicyclobacillus cycloheptanicus]|uniref:Spore germination protein n=1 Tax=Alicyclobacillus cycloheptanicus TaxID=1457 RepID=A0ABT9XER5_9BACL|nr:GerAB/ArcD/ProY family transporter [Alicyclobacillus cycloheptanicus]MDQ0188784.1 hypothetical protein [Alicyclobacillus cycloheptanicus]WDM00559.1 GerAB/ArcD/ProY family transporter [Alicyclobacillus cycloheptanicus]